MANFARSNLRSQNPWSSGPSSSDPCINLSSSIFGSRSKFDPRTEYDSQHPLFPSTICELWAWRDCWAIGPLDRNYWALNGPPIHMVVSRSIYLWDSQWAEHITEWILEFAARPLSDVRLTNRASTSGRARYLVSSKIKQGSSVMRRAKSVESKAMFSPQSLEQNGDFPTEYNDCQHFSTLRHEVLT